MEATDTTGLCKVDGCDRPKRAQGFCGRHYQRWKKWGDPAVVQNRWTGHVKTPKKCLTEWCDRIVPKGRCARCHTRLHKHGSTEIVLDHFRKYQFREDFFDTWTSASAWFLGWAITDGSVAKRALEFGLMEREPLEIFGRLLEHPGPISHRKRGEFVKRFCSKRLVKRLIELGVVPDKTLTVQMPPVPDEVFGHFARGVVEGDGWISRPHRPLRITIGSASEPFLVDLMDRIPSAGHIYDVTKPESVSRFYHLNYHGSYAAILCEWMYRDSEGMRLTRKYERWVGHQAKLGTS
jgi:hypothetical protein